MMGTLAGVLARKNISTPIDRYRAEVKGDIEDVDGVLKITRIHVHYFLEAQEAQEKDVEAAMEAYITKCPAAQSVIGCIEISHEMTFN